MYVGVGTTFSVTPRTFSGSISLTNCSIASSYALGGGGGLAVDVPAASATAVALVNTTITNCTSILAGGGAIVSVFLQPKPTQPFFPRPTGKYVPHTVLTWHTSIPPPPAPCLWAIHGVVGCLLHACACHVLVECLTCGVGGV